MSIFQPQHTTLGLWTGRSTFFWAAAAATIGLGNLWHFPWLAYQFGGGYFVALYLLFLVLITLPLVLAEAALGRHSRHGMVLAVFSEARSRRMSPHWRWVGRASVLAAFFMLSITLVIGSICLAYVLFGASGQFAGATSFSMTQLLGQMVESPHRYRGFLAWHLVFIALVGIVSLREVRVERAFRTVMPVFLMVLSVLVWWTSSHGRGDQALNSVTGLRWQDVSLQTVWLALIHAFYTLGIGLGIWAIFGAFSAPGTPLKRSVLAVVLLEVLVGVMAGVVIYGLADAMAGSSDARGLGLVFVALPVGVGQLEHHQYVGTAVFGVILLVAWTSALALAEVVVGWLREWAIAPRAMSVVLVLVCGWLVGLVTLFSFNIWSEVTLAGLTPYRWLEVFTSGLLIPVVAVGLALFLGWFGSVRYLSSLLGDSHEWLTALWSFVLRFMLPVVVVVVGLSYSLGSLPVLCRNGDLLWCAQSSHQMSPEHDVDGQAQGHWRGPGKAAEY